MTSQEIRQLVALLPQESSYPAGLTGGARIQHCLNDPEFAWNFVMSHIQLGKRLPVQARTPMLVRAYRWRARGTADAVMDEVHGLTHPAVSDTRDLLQALLITDMRMESIAELLGLPLEVVQAFEALHWNVRDRLKEAAYIGRLVYPATRLALMDGTLPPVSAGQRLLQAAYEHGADEVLFLAGLSRQRELEDSAFIYPELEAEILRTGLRYARHGFANRRDVPALKNAQALLAAQKRAAAQPTEAPRIQAILTLGDSVADELEKVAREDARRQLDVLKNRAGDRKAAP